MKPSGNKQEKLQDFTRAPNAVSVEQSSQQGEWCHESFQTNCFLKSLQHFVFLNPQTAVANHHHIAASMRMIATKRLREHTARSIQRLLLVPSPAKYG
jgi:hypothetical protein